MFRVRMGGKGAVMYKRQYSVVSATICDFFLVFFFFLPETFNSSFKLTIFRARMGERCAVTYKSQNSVFLPEYLTFFHRKL